MQLLLAFITSSPLTILLTIVLILFFGFHILYQIYWSMILPTFTG